MKDGGRAKRIRLLLHFEGLEDEEGFTQVAIRVCCDQLPCVFGEVEALALRDVL